MNTLAELQISADHPNEKMEPASSKPFLLLVNPAQRTILIPVSPPAHSTKWYILSQYPQVFRWATLKQWQCAKYTHSENSGRTSHWEMLWFSMQSPFFNLLVQSLKGDL